MPEQRTFGRRRSLPAKTTSAPKESPKAEPGPASESSGWGAMDKLAGQAGGDLYLKVSEDPTVIKIIDADPFDNYVAHWVEEIREGSKSVRCWGTSECPLCGIGDKPKKFAACFNVISFEDPEVPELRVWEAGVKIARQLRDIALDERRGPLDRADLYFTIARTQKAKATEYHLERIRARDLAEETGIEPLDEDEITQFVAERRTEPVKELLDSAEMGDLVKTLLDD
ncbi:hypothetical protein ACIGXM_14155 [Kitasatospora sp. NPDC052896]|uniref:hypothetical protein n=1 Tax=Kitasatospora sp. NPDC052896 TaxID=3364061 RepID=UPI0037C68B4B